MVVQWRMNEHLQRQWQRTRLPLFRRLEPWLSERAGGGAVDPVVRPSDHADAQINGALLLLSNLAVTPEISLPRSLSQVNLTISAPRLRSQDLGLSTSPLLIAPSITC